MSTEKIIMQQQFEEWARSQCMQPKKDGVVTTYAYERTDLAWNAWMASRAAIEVELPPIWEQGANSALGQACAQIRTADVQAIESLGLKVKS